MADHASTPLDPPYVFDDYTSTVLRSPGKALVMPPLGLSELTGPRFGSGDVRDTDADLTLHGSGEAIGERIVVHGSVTDSLGKPVRNTLVEVWQANAWRPAHIHFSLFGRAFTQRLVTQMYFPGDPLFFQDPIFNAVRDERVRRRMVSSYDHGATRPEWATGYRFDIVLGGAEATPMED